MVRKAFESRMRAEGRGPTIFEHLVLVVGLVKGGNAVWELVVWTMARDAAGQPPTWEQFRDAGVWSVPATFRAQRRLREAFGGDEGIAQVADVVMERSGKEIRSLQKWAEGDRVPEAGMIIAGSLPMPAGART
jgi:hypothetical protein